MSLDPDALAVMSLVGMTTLEERLYLRQLAEVQFTGRGAVVDLGSWLGSTVIALAQGLELNRREAVRPTVVHAYDLFRWATYMDGHVANGSLAGVFLPGDCFLDEFRRRVAPWQGRVAIHEGDLAQAAWGQGPIELLIVDAMKSWELCTAISCKFYPSLLPGVSRLLHQDFAHYATPWIPLAMYRLQDCFQPVAHVPNSGTVDFLCVAAPGENDLARASARDVSAAELEAAFAYARQITDAAVWPQLDAAQVLALSQAGFDNWPLALRAARKKYPHKQGLFDEVARKLAEQPGAAAEPSPGVDQAWQVMLQQSLPPLMAGVKYQLAWRMRADAQRSAHVTITTGHEPWTQMGPYLPYRVGQPWQELRIKFSPTSDELDPVVQFRLGESEQPFELADVMLTPITRPKSAGTRLEAADWQLVFPDAPTAVVAAQGAGDGVRVEFHPPADGQQCPRPTDSVRLEHDLEPLLADTDYQLRFQARADRGRDVDLALAEAHEPWRELGLYQRVRLWPEWQSFATPFRLPVSEFDPRLVVQAGGSRVPFELSQVTVVGAGGATQQPELRGWHLRWEPTTPAAMFFVPGPPDGVRVTYPVDAVAEPPNDGDWKIQVQHQAPALLAGTRCRLTLRAQADRAREISLTLLQGSEPFEPLGWAETVRIWPAWRDLEFNFTVSGDDPEPRLAIRVGGTTTPVEVADLRLECTPPFGSRQTIALDDPAQRLLWRAVSTPTRLVSRSGGWRLEFPQERPGH